jgi:hypothetical protein
LERLVAWWFWGPVWRLLQLLKPATCAPFVGAFGKALVHVTPAPYLASLLLSVIGGSLFNVLCGFMVGMRGACRHHGVCLGAYM